MPSWLIEPGPVLMKNANRRNKYEPIVQEVELVEANPSYSFVRLPDGREVSVSNRQLAPAGGRGVDDEDEGDDGNAGEALDDDERDEVDEADVQENWEIPSSITPSSPENTPGEPQEDVSADNAPPSETNSPLPNPRTPGPAAPDGPRRSRRTRRRPDRLSEFVCKISTRYVR